MTPSLQPTVTFTGFRSNDQRKRMQQAANTVREQQAEEAKRKADEARAEALKKADADIREALSTTLYTDKQGPFQGWHLLKLIQDSSDYCTDPYYGDYAKGSLGVEALKEDLAVLKATQGFEQLINRFKTLELVKKYESSQTYSRGNNGEYLTLTERGTEVLNIYKKNVAKKRWFSKQRGTYTFAQPEQPKELK